MDNHYQLAILAAVGLVVLSDSGKSQAAIPPRAAEDFAVVPDLSTGQRTAWPILNNWCPGVSQNPVSEQWVFDVPLGVPPTIRSIAFRRGDIPTTPHQPVPSFTITIEAWMAHSLQSPSQRSYLYAANRGSDFRQVVARRTLNFAAEPWRADGNYPFTYRIPFDQPFSLRGGSVGLFELRLLDTTLCRNLVHPDLGLLDHYRAVRPPASGPITVTIGQSCAPIGGRALATTLVSSAVSAGNAGARLLWVPENDFAQARTIFFAGGSATRWSGLALPFALDGAGAPGCTVYASLDWELPHLSVYPNLHTAVLVAPNDPGLVGANVYAQGVRLGARFNPLGVIATNAIQFTILAHGETPIAWGEWTATSTFQPGVSSYGDMGPIMMLDGR